MYFDGIKEYLRAKKKAAGELGVEVFPNNLEIRRAMDRLADEVEGPEQRRIRLRHLRQQALVLMELLDPHHPRLIGSVLSGMIHRNSDIDIHTFSDDHSRVGRRLAEGGHDVQLEIAQVRKGGEDRDFPHYFVEMEAAVADISVYPEVEFTRPQKSSVTHRKMERASAGRLRQLIADSAPRQE